MREFKLLDICLSLFDGGAAGGDGAGAAAPGGDGSGDSGGSQASPAAAGRGGPPEADRDTKADAGKRRGPGEARQKVLYGKQPKPAGEDGPSDAGEGREDAPDPERRKRAYRALVEGEYKDQYAEDTQHIVQSRLKETKGQMAELQRKLDQVQPLVDALAQRYKIADGDVAKLAQAVESDDAYWSQAAEEAGMSVEQYKRLQRLERENAALLRSQQRTQEQQRAERRLQKWDAEAKTAKEAYPSFDLEAEAREPQFLSMLRSGVPIKTAYEVIHMDEIKAGIAQTQAKAAEKRVVDGIRAKGARPQENGTSSQGAFLVKDDVSKLTGKDIRDIIRRVEKGETITF